MSENPGQGSSPPQGRDPGNASQDGAGGEGQEPQYLTADALQDHLEDFGNKILEDAKRFTQSQVDKTDHRITERIREEFQGIDRYAKMMAETGNELSPEQVKALKSAARDQVLQGDTVSGEGSEQDPSSPKGDQQQEQPPGQGQGGNVVEQMLFLQQKEAGIFLQDNDPEMELVPEDPKTLRELQNGVDKAIRAKAKRLAGVEDDDGDPNQETDEERRTRLAAQQPGGGSGNRKRAPSSPDDLDTMDRLSRGYSNSK